MKPAHKKIINIAIAIMLVIAMPMLASAQIDGVPVEPEVPLDGGLSLLVAAGVGYGAKKLKKTFKHK